MWIDSRRQSQNKQGVSEGEKEWPEEGEGRRSGHRKEEGRRSGQRKEKGEGVARGRYVTNEKYVSEPHSPMTSEVAGHARRPPRLAAESIST
jgi:hypothetical protein